MEKMASSPVKPLTKQEHRLNEIEARKTWVKTVQIYCAAARKRLVKGVNSPR